jgi:hypothetical protein
MTIRIPSLFCFCGREMVLERSGIRLLVESTFIGPTAIVEAEELKCAGCGMRIRRVTPGTDPITSLDPGFDKAPYDETVRLL